MKVGAKVTRKEVMKKRTTMVKSFSSFDSEVPLPPLEELYVVLEVAPKNDQQLVRFLKVKWEVPNSIMSFSIFFSLFEYIS
jgi:hypothetical protein